MTRIAHWHDVDHPIVWYPAWFLDPAKHMGRSVLLSGSGWQVTGRIGVDDKAKIPSWQEWRAFEKRWASLAPWRSDEVIDVRRAGEPTAFRPLEGSVWAGDLPQPIVGWSPRPMTTAATFAAHDADPIAQGMRDTDGWPFPGLRLGCRVPPETDKECEARVLRAYRHMASMPRVGIQHRTIAADWPAEWYYIGDRINRQEAAKDGHIGDERVAWVSTRRDATDWDYALDWIKSMRAGPRELIEKRAANPPWSFWQIADRDRTNPDTVRKRYRAAIELAFELARAS